MLENQIHIALTMGGHYNETTTMRKQYMKKNKKSILGRIGPKGLFVVGLVTVITALGIIVANLQTKSHNSKAAETLIDCVNICTTYLPHNKKYTTDKGKASCEKSCEKVRVEIATKGTPCEKACTLKLMGRAGVCQLVCKKAGIK